MKVHEDEEFRAYLESVIDLLFAKASETVTWSEWAKEAGLAYQTIANLGTYKTKHSQFRTIWRMAEAIGMEATPRLKKLKRLAKAA